MTLADQKDRDLAVRSRDRTVWIEAGAGTGKTRTLVERIVGLVRGNPGVPLTRMAAITFTEKAAAELKVKIREALEMIRVQSPGDEPTRQALEDLDVAPIMTLHGFSQWILRKRPMEAGIDPEAGLLDDAAETELLARAYDEWFDACVRESDDALRWYLAQKEYWNRRDEHDWLWSLCRAVVEYSDLLLDRPADRRVDVLAEFAKLSAEAVALFNFAEIHCTDETDKGFLNAKTYIESLTPLPTDDVDRITAGLPPSGALKLNVGNKKGWPVEELAAFKEMRKALRAMHDAFARTMYAPRVWDLYEHARDFAHAYDERKRHLGVMGFQDLLVRTARLLREDPGGVRAALRESFDQILIDEFQDTDPLQIDIASFLVEAAGVGTTATPPKPGKLLVVGDPKQSIYRFRRADIESYESAKALWTPGAAPLRLTVNFRCAPGIVDAVNRVFSDMMKFDPDLPAGPDYAPLVAGRGAGHGNAVPHGAGVVLLEPDRVLTTGDDHRAIGYRAVADWIAESVAGGRLIADPATGKFRPMRFGDVAILNRRGTTFDIMEEALRARRVPYLVIGGKAYYRRPEVVAAVSGLRALADPDDSLALAEWLTGDLAGFADEDLAVHILAGGRLSYHDAREDGDALEAHLARLRVLHENRDRVGCRETFRGLVDAGAGWGGALLSQRAEVAVANLRRIEDAAREADRSLTLFARFVERWADALESDREDADHAVAEEGDDVVRVLTIHKAKGLDWPVVVLVDLDAESKFRAPALWVSRVKSRVEAQLAKGMETEGFEEAKDREKVFEKAEALRVLYVGMTRARDYLVLPVFPKVIWNRSGTVRKRNDYLNFFAQAGLMGDDYRPNAEFAGLSVERVETQADAMAPDVDVDAATAAWDDDVEALVAPWLIARDAADDWPDAEGAPRWTSPSALVKDDGADARATRKARGGVDHTDARTLGTAFHALMEHLDWNREDTWPAAVESTARRHGLDITGREKLATWLSSFAATELFRALRSARRLTEVPFVVGDDRSASDNARAGYEGRIDVLAFVADEVWIVDFKTDRVTAKEAPGRARDYAAQGAVYREAALAVGHGKVRVFFAYVDPGINVEMTAES